MKALVTGGAGFIGSNLVTLLLGEGHEVIILDNLSSGYRENLDPGAAFTQGDVRDKATVVDAASGCDVVIHLGASVGNARSIADPIADSAVNMMGTLNVLESARAAGIERVVFSSSAGIFGELKTLPIAEDHPTDPDSPYGVSKLGAEKMCLVFNKLWGMKNVCLRYFNVYGPRQRFDSYGNCIPIFADRILRDQTITIFGDGEQTRDFVHARDVARANLAAATSPVAAGSFNVASGSRISINELVRMMIELSARSVGIEYGPPRPGDVRDSIADITKAREILGYEPVVQLEEGLGEYLQWMLDDPVGGYRS